MADPSGSTGSTGSKGTQDGEEEAGGRVMPPSASSTGSSTGAGEDEEKARREAERAERAAAREKTRQERAEKAAQQREEKAAQKKAASEQKAAKDKAAAEQKAAEKKAAEKKAADERVASERSGDTDAGAEKRSGTMTMPAVVSKLRGDRSSAESRDRSGTRERTDSRPSRSSGRTRRAQLRLVQLDAWSVMKTSFLLSIALGIVLVVAVGIIWTVLGAAGVFESINSIAQQAVGSPDGPQFDIRDYVGTSRVLGFAMIVAVVDVILITAIATLGAFLYNLSAALLGGIEVTLAEDK